MFSLSTTTIGTAWLPTKTQSSYCDKWYSVDAGNTCEIIRVKFATQITVADL